MLFPEKAGAGKYGEKGFNPNFNCDGFIAKIAWL
jgi:hypothetical protein